MGISERQCGVPPAETWGILGYFLRGMYDDMTIRCKIFSRFNNENAAINAQTCNPIDTPSATAKSQHAMIEYYNTPFLDQKLISPTYLTNGIGNDSEINTSFRFLIIDEIDMVVGNDDPMRVERI